MSGSQVAYTIVEQLGGIGRLTAMIGANNFVRSDEGLAFRIGRGGKNGINVIDISLNAMDLYDVKFAKVNGIKVKWIATVDGVYCDQLKGVIEENIGMYLSL